MYSLSAVLVTAALIFTIGLTTIYFGLIWLCTSLFPGQGERVERIFVKVKDDGRKFMTITAIGLFCVSESAPLRQSSPTTCMYLGCLTFCGFACFFFCPLVGTDAIFIFYSFIGVAAHLTIIGICSTHFLFADKYGFYVMLASLVYELVMIFSHQIYKKLIQALGLNLPLAAAAEIPQIDRQVLYDSWAKQGITYTTGGGLALLGAASGSFGQKLAHSQTLKWIACYNGVAFWLFQGAIFLESGFWFELWILVGMSTYLGIAQSLIMVVYYPDSGLELYILFISTMMVFIQQKWGWLHREVVNGFVNRFLGGAHAHEQ